MENRLKGKIKFVNHKAKFGFIRDIDSDQEYYFSTSDFHSDKEDPGDATFSFTLKDAKKGPQAVDLREES